LVVGGWVQVVGGQHRAAPLRITHPVPDNTITTHCDAVPNHQPLTTNHVFRVDRTSAHQRVILPNDAPA
jgi:hypothetical protein